MMMMAMMIPRHENVIRNCAFVGVICAGIEPWGNCVNAPARFIVETFSAGRGEVEVIVLNPKGQREPVSN